MKESTEAKSEVQAKEIQIKNIQQEHLRNVKILQQQHIQEKKEELKKSSANEEECKKLKEILNEKNKELENTMISIENYQKVYFQFYNKTLNEMSLKLQNQPFKSTSKHEDNLEMDKMYKRITEYERRHNGNIIIIILSEQGITIYDLKKKIEELEKQINPSKLALINENFNQLRGARENADDMEQIFDDGQFLSNWRNNQKRTIFIIADTNVFINKINIITTIYNNLCNWRTQRKINCE